MGRGSGEILKSRTCGHPRPLLVGLSLQFPCSVRRFKGLKCPVSDLSRVLGEAGQARGLRVFEAGDVPVSQTLSP